MTLDVPCPGCRARFAESDGPTHRYIGASPGCWAVYSALLVRDHDEPDWPREHRLIVDAYAAQHPGTESLQATRSVAGHLIALHLVLERGLPFDRITEMTHRHSKRPEFRWLEPPTNSGNVTVLDLYRERDPTRYAHLCREWARTVWASWRDHHETIRAWALGDGSTRR